MAGNDITVDAFRRQAREGMEANLQPASGLGRRIRGHDLKTRESIAPERALQRKLYEAGYAGISWPVEYGGRSLTEEHETAFEAEAGGFRLPDFGVVGGTTFGICAVTMI